MGKHAHAGHGQQPQPDAVVNQRHGFVDVGGAGRLAGAQTRAVFQLAVVDRRAAQGHAQRAGAGGHHRAGVGAVPGGGLGAPAAQGVGGVAEQGVAQRGEAGRNVVEHVVDARRRPAEAQVAFVAVAPHGVQRVGEAEHQCARAAQERKPEQRAEDRVVAVFEHGFDGGLGDAGFVELAGIAGDDPRQALARAGQIARDERRGHCAGVFGQAAAADRKIQQAHVQQQAQPDVALAQRTGQRHPRQYGGAPGQEADAPIGAEAPEQPLDRRRVAPETDQRMMMRRLAEQAVEEKAEAHRNGYGEQGGEVRGGHGIIESFCTLDCKSCVKPAP